MNLEKLLYEIEGWLVNHPIVIFMLILVGLFELATLTIVLILTYLILRVLF